MSIVSAPSESTQRPCLYLCGCCFLRGSQSELHLHSRKSRRGLNKVADWWILIMSCDVDEPLKLTEEPLYRRWMPTPGPSKQATLASAMAISGSFDVTDPSRTNFEGSLLLGNTPNAAGDARCRSQGMGGRREFEMVLRKPIRRQRRCNSARFPDWETRM